MDTQLLATLEGRSIAFSQMRTLNDLRLMQLGWVYDINFPSTSRRLRKSGYLEALADGLPDSGGVRSARQAVLDYVSARLGSLDDSDGSPDADSTRDRSVEGPCR